MVHSLNRLGKRIEWELIHHPSAFNTLDRTVRSYKGVDWKSYVKSNTCTYTELDAYYNRGVKISIATWLPGQYAMLNKGPGTKCWITVLKGIISTFTTDEDKITGSYTISGGDMAYIDDDRQTFMNNSVELVVSLQVYYPYTISRFA
jgi:hypothetical protein